MNTAEATIRVRNEIYAYLKEVEATTAAMRNLAPTTYAQTWDKIQYELAEQERRLLEPPSLIYIDEIKPVLHLKRNGNQGEIGRKRK